MDSFEENHKIVEERKKQEEQKKLDSSKNNLKSKIKISINNTMIGSIVEFENNFGHIWGHKEENPTEEHLKNREIWEKIRKAIMDKGKIALDKALWHIDQNNIKSNKNYKFTYNYKNRNND